MNIETQPWRRNLYVIAAAEFMAIMGMTLFAPFMPLFVQQLGNLGNEEAALWSGIATGVAGVAMFISSPFWGIAADRWGRKPMLLRALIGGSIVISLLTVASNIYFVVGLRFVQGLLTGTVSAASALVASITPQNRLPASIGILMGAIFGGQTLGPLLGGYLAGAFGFTITFVVTALLLLASGLTVLFLVKESFIPPAREQSPSANGLLKLAFSRELLPVLVIMAFINLGPQMISPILSLIFKNFSDKGAAASAGEAFSLMGIVTVISSLFFGRLSGRTPLRVILTLCCIGTGLFYLPPIWANSSVQLIILFGLTGILNGGMIASVQSLISLRVASSRQGTAYGLGQSANAVGFGIGPFLGGGLVPLIGLKPVFGVAAGFLIFAGLLTGRTVRK